MKQIHVCRDQAGDQGYTLWTDGPVFSFGEWAPVAICRGRIPYSAITPTMARTLVGRELEPGECESLTVGQTCEAELTNHGS